MYHIDSFLGITVDRLGGYAESCDAVVELLVTKHPELKAVKIGPNYPIFIKITDSGLLTLLTADGLTKVSLSKALLITGETLKHVFNSAQHIQDLALIDCSLTDKGLLKILGICGIQLTSLDVTGSTVTGEGFHVLKDKFSNMEKLCLEKCVGLTQQGLLQILKMCGSRLQDLNISETDITGQGLEELQEKFADLKALSLYCCKNVTDQGLLKVLRMCGTKLQDLDITGTNITGQGLEKMQEKFADLKALNLSYCSRLTDQGLLKVLRMCGAKLQDLDISGTDISGQGLEELQEKFADLKALNLRLCRNLRNCRKSLQT